VRAALLSRLGTPVDADLLDQALVHRSWAYENGGVATNERLEFLGDSVLGLVVTDALYHRHPDLPEGRLAKLRAAVVNMRALAEVARGLDLGSCVRLGRGEEATGGRDKASILADTTEAVIGAAYLSSGVDAARDLVLRLVGPLLDASADLGAGADWKTSLQELGAAHGLGPVTYAVTETGPDHAKVFSATAGFAADGAPSGTGTGGSKKEAEQAAAAAAWRALSASTGAAAGTASSTASSTASGTAGA